MPTILLDVNDLAVASMSLQELRSRITLVPDSLCWLSHWNDQALKDQAEEGARQLAMHNANAAARFYRNTRLLMKIGKPEEATVELEKSQQERRKITEVFEKLEKNLDTEKGKEMFKVMTEARKPYAAAQDKLLDLLKSNKADEAIPFLLGNELEME